MPHTGGCFCGLVRFRSAQAPDHATMCHCCSCRRASGAPAVGWASFALASFELTAQRPAEFRSSPGVVRTFCATCGTPLTYWHEQWPDIIDVAIGTLDVPEDVQPQDHIWMSDAVAWDQPNDGLKHYPHSRLQE